MKKVAITLVLISILLTTSVTARYLLTNDSEKSLASLEDFYFKSNVVQPNKTPIYIFSDYKEGDYINIDLYNYIDELRYTKKEIEFEITTDVNLDSKNIIRGNWEGDNLKKNQVKIKVPENLFKDGKVQIRLDINVTSPYKERYSAILNVYQTLDSDDVKVSVTDDVNNFISILNIETYGLEGVVTFKYPNNLKPDKTDTRITDITNDTFKVTVNKNSKYSYILLKSAPADTYTIDEKDKFEIIKKSV